MTNLRKMMLEELERRNYSAEHDAALSAFRRAVRTTLRQVPRQARSRSSSHLPGLSAQGERSSDPGTVENHVAALRFLFIRTLHRHEFRQFLPYPKTRRKLPKILSLEEVARLIDASSGLFRAYAADGSVRHRHAPRLR